MVSGCAWRRIQNMLKKCWKYCPCQGREHINTIWTPCSEHPSRHTPRPLFSQFLDHVLEPPPEAYFYHFLDILPVRDITNIKPYGWRNELRDTWPTTGKLWGLSLACRWPNESLSLTKCFWAETNSIWEILDQKSRHSAWNCVAHLFPTILGWKSDLWNKKCKKMFNKGLELSRRGQNWPSVP